MKPSELPRTEEEIDSKLEEVRCKLQEISESPAYKPKNAKDFESLEKMLQALARKQADLIAAKKNMQSNRG